MTSTSTPATLTTFSSGVIASQEAQAMPMSPTAAAQCSPHPPRRAQNLNRAPQHHSNLSNATKANVHAAVRTVLDKGHEDNQECFCLITGFSNYERVLGYAHIVPGTTPSNVVSLPVNTWFKFEET